MKILNKLRNASPLLLVAALSFILDQLTKWLVIKKLDVYAQIEVIAGFFNLFHIRNPGAAFGILQGQQTFLIIFSFSFHFIVRTYHWRRQALFPYFICWVVSQKKAGICVQGSFYALKWRKIKKIYFTYLEGFLGQFVDCRHGL